MGKYITKSYLLDNLKNFNTDIVKKEIPNVVELTQAEYNALGDEKLTNGVIYFISDAK